MDKKHCPSCEKSLTLDLFHVRPNGKPCSYCKVCNKDNSKRHYKNNKAVYIERSKTANVLVRKRMFLIIQEAKEKPCKDCEVQYPHYVMDFDHLPEHKKRKNVADLVNFGSERMLRIEIEKFDVVCSNCHRKRTFQRNLEKANQI